MKIKKMLAIILSVLLIIGVAPLSIFEGISFGNITVYAATDGYYAYTVSNGEATITDCQTSISGEIIIPDTLGGYPVTSIGSSAFLDCISLIGITIPDGVTNIGNSAFKNCNGLLNIVISKSVSYIDEEAFYGCINLKRVNISDMTAWCNIDFHREYSNPLYYAQKLYLNGKSVKDLVIPEDITIIKNYTFYNCRNLTSATLHEGITSIGNRSFSRCESLGSVNIPESVSSIGHRAFEMCTSLTNIKIPDNLVDIESYIFSDCENLISVELPNNISSIVEGLFYNCSSLSSIILPESIKEIYSFAFSGCSSLANITIPNSVISIGFGAFKGCTSLTDITIPDSVRSIDGHVFENCNNLEKITLPFVGGSLHGINGTHFGYIFGSSDYSNNASYVPTSLKEVVITGDILIKDNVFYGCTSLESITLPDTITSIGSKAFSYCSSLINITIPDGVTNIGSSAFSGCTSLGSINIPEVVTSIGSYAFSDCTSLTSVTIPDSVTSIGKSAFYKCTSLEKITLPFVGNTLGGTSNTHFGYIFGASNYSNNASYVPTSLKELILTGGNVIRYNSFWGCSNLICITIPNSVTAIGYSAFDGCKNLTNIIIPNSVTTIGSGAFKGCNSLINIKLPDNIIRIEYDMFYDCSNLTSITIPSSVTNIGSNAFSGCNSLTAVNVSDLDAWFNITFANSNANPMQFAGNLYLNNQLFTDLVLEPDSYIIDTSKYKNYKCIENVYIPSMIFAIKENAFYNCSGIKNVYYEGDEEEWADMSIYEGNEYLQNATIHFNCDSIPSSIASVEISKLPDKLKYVVNEDELDLSGGVLTVKDLNENSSEISLTQLSVEGFDNSVLGKQTLIVKYGEFSVQFEVEVIIREIESVAISKLPEKLQYFENEEKLNLVGGVLTVKYTTDEVLDINLSTLSVEGFDNSVLGKQTLTVRYGEFSVPFEIEIISRPIEFIVISKQPLKINYIIGEALDLTGAKLAVGYQDGTYKLFDITIDMISGFNSYKTGVQYLDVVYSDLVDTIKITVFGNSDANGDGVINAADLVELQKAFLNKTADDLVYDINADGKTDIRDLVALKEIIAK